VCHQTVSLVSRHLEANGLPTVIVGSARDIVEHCGVARFYFSDFPLGNPCGHPWDREMQAATVESALRLLESARGPRTTLRSPFEWKPDPGWRARYNRVRPEDREKLLAIGDARRKARGQPPRAGLPGDR
jgi:D-proline reductase (dithiol) PrdB